MKLFLALAVAVFSLYFITSCTKTNNVTTTIRDSTTIRDTVVIKDTVVLTTPKNPIFGLWVGTYKVNLLPQTDSFYYSLAIGADSSVFVSGSGENGVTYYAVGPWQLNGTAFSATVTTMNATTPENIQVLTAVYDSTTGVLSNGAWVDTQGGTEGPGTFAVKRLQ